MAQIVHKQILKADTHEYVLPAGAEIIHVGWQHDRPCMWYRFDVSAAAATTARRICLTGTGHQFPDEEWLHLGSMMTPGQSLVFHVFESAP